jgi:predicted nuclease of predicted toxin-antitoxin system
MDVGLLNAGDDEIRVYAVNEGMTIVTKDEDFAIMRRLSANSPAVVWVRIGNATNRVLVERLRPVLTEVLDALADGESIVEVR